MDENTLLSIKKFSEFTGVKQSTLRYYDEIGLLPSSSRGDNNYRYYIPFQIIELNFINVLIDLGVPLATIKDMNIERTPEKVLELLASQEIRLDKKLHDLRTAYSIIHTYRGNIHKGLAADKIQITVEEHEEAYIILGRENAWRENEMFYTPFMDFCTSAEDYRINLRFPVGAFHHDINEFINAPGRPNMFFSSDPYGNYKRPAGEYMCAYVRGYYGEFGDLADKMTDYAKAHHLEFKGPVYTIYLLDEVSIREQHNYLSQVAVEVVPQGK